jgi:stearoyl-CoA desaturase (delta-9 desaturase)
VLKLFKTLNKIPLQTKSRILWWVGLVFMIFGLLHAAITSDWIWILSILIFQKIVSPFSNGIALHRYFSHRSFETGPLRHKFLLYISVFAAAGSPIVWSAIHRHHHRHSDTEYDIHSPNVNLLDSAGYWGTRSHEWMLETKKLTVFPKDLIQMPDVAFVHRNYYAIWVGICLVSLLISWELLVFFTLPMLGLVPLTTSIALTILSHKKIPGSYKNFDSGDWSYNNKWLHWWTLQEGLHNNHHKHPEKYNQAMGPWEFDPAGWIIEKFFDTKKIQAH